MSDETINDLLTALITVLILLLPVTSAIIVRLAKQYLARLDAKLKVELKGNQYFLLQEMADLFIRSAEQMLIDNADKFVFAKRRLQQFAKDNDIPLTDELSDDLIEGLLKGVKQGLHGPQQFTTGEMRVSRGA